MEEKPIETIHQAVQRLVYFCSKSHEDIALVQLVADSSFPVLIPSSQVTDPSIFKHGARVLSFNKLTQKMKEEFEDEQVVSPETNEIIKKVQESFDDLKKSIAKKLDKAQKKITSVYLDQRKVTTEFLNQCQDGFLNQNEKFLSSFEELLRSYELEERKEKAKQLSNAVPVFCSNFKFELKTQLRTLMDLNTKPSAGLESKLVPGPEAHSFFSRILSTHFLRPKFQLLFRASEHDFLSSKFHAMCDGKGPTIVIIKNSKGFVFGGFSKISWESSGDRPDDSAFLYSFKHKEIYGQNSSKRMYALRFSKGWGPAYGAGGPTLVISNNCMSNQSSGLRNDAGSSFNFGQRSIEEIAGSEKFSVEDYEVFGVS